MIEKSRKIDIFPNGLVHGFGTNYEFLRLFFLGQIGYEKVFRTVLDRKPAFLDYKNIHLKKSKKLTILQRG